MFPQNIVSTHRDVSKLEDLNVSDDEQLSIYKTTEKRTKTKITTPPSKRKSNKSKQKKYRQTPATVKNKRKTYQQQRNNGYHHHKNGLNNHYHYNPNYWECDSDDAIIDDTDINTNNNTTNNQSPIPTDFPKVNDFNAESFVKIMPVMSSTQSKSKLQLLIQGIEQNTNKHGCSSISPSEKHFNGNGSGNRTPSRNANGRYFQSSDVAFRPFFCTFHFEEYLGQEALTLEIKNPWTVAQSLTHAIKAYSEVFPKRSLTGICSEDYELRLYEDGEIDCDISAFARLSLIHELGDSVFGCKLNVNRKQSIIQGGSIPSVTAKHGAYLPTVGDRMFLRISIPGPQNEAHVLSIDKDSTALTVRDIYALLNKKKQSVQFHPEFFNIYYNGNTKLSQSLMRSTKVKDLEQNSLIILPRILTENDNIQDAYQFELVKLANEQREFFAMKIKSNTKNKKRLLIVDRHRIVKKPVDENTMFGTAEHIPIDINLITNCAAKNGKFNKQFLIEYQQKGTLKSQTYEMASTAECQQIVAKVRYLSALRKYRGS